VWVSERSLRGGEEYFARWRGGIRNCHGEGSGVEGKYYEIVTRERARKSIKWAELGFS
jgi:hypothetical protein